ncbi:hypothetical protein [Mucilaginibacter sp.]|uniref:hypothetical protein n=1 Tax=Mucilaginibacter sp. TaxID=1882438 RepID=UPI00284BCFC6|nr:hypothetical protein [Mucilaginibacter sp.]MDR3694208.1 hypothetical protein [Mucilaginibacter sp.]
MRKTHIKTDFINFIIEKYSTTNDDDKDEETPKKKDNDEDDDEKDTSKKSTEDDEIIEKLLNEYKNLKKQYENRRVSDRRK